MNNVDRMIAGLRCCAERIIGCRGQSCPLFEMCNTNELGLAGVLRIAAEMLDALSQQRDEWQRRAQDAEAQHRVEYCEEADYDCETLGKIRAALDQVKQERDSAIDDVEKAESCFACKCFKPNGGTCGGGKRCIADMIQAEVDGREYKGPYWEWRGVHEVKEDA